MKVTLNYLGHTYQASLADPIDISIPLIPGSDAPNCFWAPHFDAVPVRSGDWIGDTRQGGDVNFKTVTLNPHGNGTHTESVGHIATEAITINEVLTDFHFVGLVVSIYPQALPGGDRVLSTQQIIDAIGSDRPQALIIRTMPNSEDKRRRVYSGTNPPYLDASAIAYIVSIGIEHLLLDLPSVDREQDGGALAGHKAFWDYPATLDRKKTITEMIFVNNSVSDGLYLLNLQIVSFEIDASPSKPILYQLIKK